MCRVLSVNASRTFDCKEIAVDRLGYSAARVKPCASMHLA